jgi:hypothetical protein
MARELVLVPKEKYQNLLQSEEKLDSHQEKPLLPKKDPPNTEDSPTPLRIT